VRVIERRFEEKREEDEEVKLNFKIS